MLELITVRVRYQHSLLPPEVECRSESKCDTTMIARNLERRRSSSGGKLASRKRRDAHRPRSGKLLDDHENWMTEGILRVLDEEYEAAHFSTVSSPEAAGVCTALIAGDALKFINDFLRVQSIMSPSVDARLDYLRTRYQMLVLVAQTHSSMSIGMSIKSRTSPIKGRNAFEIDRMTGKPLCRDAEVTLSNITNRSEERYRGHDRLKDGHLINRARALQENVHGSFRASVSTGKKRASPLRHSEPVVPEPLFSPRHKSSEHSNGQLLRPRCRFNNVDGAREADPGSDIGISKFYEQEVRDAGDEALGRSKYKPPRSEWGQTEDGSDDDDGVANAREIWKDIDFANGGLDYGAAAGGMEDGNAQYEEDEQLERERVREMQVLGAPWLY